MRRARISTRISLALTLSLGLTSSVILLKPFPLFAGECESHFVPLASPFRSQLSSLEAKINEYLRELGVPGETRPPLRLFDSEMANLANEIRTPDELFDFWNFIDRISKTKYTNYERFALNRGERYVEKVYNPIHSLARMDFVSPIERLKNKLTPKQKKELLSLLDHLVDTPPLDPSFQMEPQRVMWRFGLLPAQIALAPKRVQTFIRAIQSIDDTAKFAFSLAKNNPNDAYAAFTQGTVTALRSLPAKEASEAREEITGLLGSKDKNLRRNYEAVHRVLFEPEFQDFFNALRSKKKMTVSEATELTSRYWRRIGLTPAYSFNEIFQVAESLQKGPLAKLYGDGNVLIIGSFPNGKAKFPTSDIDLMATGDFSKRFDKFFPMNCYPEIPHFSEHAKEAQLMKSQILSQEQNLGALLHRRIFTPGDLLSPHPDIIDADVHLQYNPISLRIAKDKITMRVYDFFGSRSFTETEISR